MIQSYLLEVPTTGASQSFFRMASRAWPMFLKPLLGLLFLGSEINGDSSHSPAISVSLGATASFSCTHGVPITSGVFWYKHSHGTAPDVILYTYSDDGDEKGRRKMTVDKASKSTKLLISQVEMADAGVYYCAARDTGNAAKVTFGSGTRLTINPDLPESEPSVYELQPADEGKDLSACLFTDYSPGSITVSSDGSDHVETNSSVVVVEGEASYGAVLWNKNPQNLRCLAEYDEREFTAKSGTADACSGEQTSFQTDERLNLLSLTVLGLRVIFFKTVAINLLLTFRLWSH